MKINMQIALANKLHIKKRVLTKGLKHMIEKSYARAYLGFAATVNFKL